MVVKPGQMLVPGVSDDVLAGAFAGLVARLTTAPFDVLKIRFQLQVHSICLFLLLIYPFTHFLLVHGKCKVH